MMSSDMQRLIRSASMTLASLSLALILLAAISGGEAQAGFGTCGTVSTVTNPDGTTSTGPCSGGWCYWTAIGFGASCGGAFGIFSGPGDACNCTYWGPLSVGPVGQD